MDMQTSDNIEIPAAVGIAAESIAKRIRSEQERLADEERKELDLAEQRKRTLMDGTDAQIDKIELAIDTSRSTQVRILERIDLLVPKLIAANQEAQAAQLDAVAERANRARLAGEKAIGEFGTLAPKLDPVLRRMRAADALVDRLNRQLIKAGRQPVPTSNGARCKPGRVFEEVERRRIGIGQVEHPHHGRATVLQSDPSKAQLSGTNELVDVFVQIDVPVTKREHAFSPPALHSTVVLPNATNNPGSIWDADAARIVDRDLDAVIAEMKL